MPLTRLSATELTRIAAKLTLIEQSTEYDTGVRRISGGFALAEMVGYTKNNIDVTLTWGVQSDCEDNVTTEHLTLDRKTLEERG
jgi:hypothetical protein